MKIRVFSYIYKSDKPQEQEDPEPGSDSEPELEGCFIDDLAHLCRSTLDKLAKEAWEAEATLQDPDKPPRGMGQKEAGHDRGIGRAINIYIYTSIFTRYII